MNMPRAGIEPAQGYPYRFLRPTRLPVPPPRHVTRKYIRQKLKVNDYQQKPNNQYVSK